MVNDVLREPFKKGKRILKILKNHNHQAYFVGGCVRDFLLHRTIVDIDIATSALPEEVKQIFSKVIPIGIEHGTVIVRYEGESFEVTTFRLDGKYLDQRHPDHVEFIDDIEYDLKRRDFTINALAMDQHGNILDLYEGKKDLQQKQIRTVGNGYERFMEDPLRIIRALRFSSQLGFFIEDDTLKHMTELKDQIDHLAIERITNECEKLFAGRYVQRAINYLIATETYKHLPLMVNYPYIVYQLQHINQPLHSFSEVIALFTLLEPNITIEDGIKAWKCSNQMRRDANALVNAVQYYREHGVDDWLIYQLTPTYFASFIRVLHILHPDEPLHETMLHDMYSKLPIQSRQDICIRGDDIIRLFPNKRQGPWISQLLTQIEQNIVCHTLPNNYHSIKEWIRCNPPETN